MLDAAETMLLLRKARTYRALAAGTLLAQFHCLQGVSLLSGVQSWRDGFGGLTLLRPGIPQAPTYAADGANFGGRSVVGSVGASNKMLSKSSLSPVLIPSGARPWIMIVARITSFAAGTRWFARVTDSPPTANVLNLYISGGVLNGGAGPTNGSTSFNDTTNPHVFEAYLTADDHSCIDVDGVTLYDSGPGAGVTAVAGNAVGIGGNSSATNACDAFYGLVLIGGAPLTAAQRARLRALAKYDLSL